MRHAERGDNQFPRQQSQISYDPPITKTSIQTIRSSALQIYQTLKQAQIKNVKFISSKFLRCIMTAQRTIEQLVKYGINVDKQLKIEQMISQYLRQDWFPTYPLNNLIFDAKNKQSYIKKKWIQSQNPLILQFPQNYVNFHQRVGKYKNKLVFPQKGCCTIVVTHGFVVRQLCWRMNEMPNIAAQVPYCGYAIFTHNGHKQKLIRAKL